MYIFCRVSICIYAHFVVTLQRFIEVTLKQTIFRMKRIYTFFFALWATTALWAFDFVGDNYLCYNITSSSEPYTVEVTYQVHFSGENYYGITSFTIPNFVEHDGITYAVTSIGERAFSNCFALKSITIPESITSIGYGAIQNCKALTSITIPNSVTSIDKFAFYGDTLLTSITIGSSVTSIGNRAFTKIGSLSKFVCLSPHITSIEEFSLSEHTYLDTLITYAAFYNMSEESQTTAPKHLQYASVIGGELTDNAFGFIRRSNKTLKVLDLSNATNTTIADEALKNCYNIEELRLPSSLTHIPYMGVAECVQLPSITIPVSVVEIGGRAFENCRMLSSVNFAEDGALTMIGDWAFYNCHELTNITIPEGVTEIGHAAFYGCTYLTEITLPSSIQEVADNGFALCGKLQKMHVKAMVPPAIHAKTFYEVNRQILVYVPDAVVEDYKANPYWKEFLIIGENTAVDNIQSPNANGEKIFRDGQLLIIREGKTYNVMGMEIK